MSLLHRPNWISPEEYLAGERVSEVRHEYFDGEVCAMSGASTNHNRIVGDVFRSIENHLSERECEAFSNDMKVRIPTKGGEWYYYPDVVVNCDPFGLENFFCDTPAIIVEVLSPETERVDRREKLMAYRMIPSLHTYVLVAQRIREVTVFRKGADGTWDTEILPEKGDTLHLPEIGFSMTLQAIYRRTGL